jgi:hypothetical protein
MNTRNQIILICLVFFLCCSAAVFANVYLWEEKDGKVHVTQTPPPTGAKLIKAIIDPTPTPTPLPGTQPKAEPTSTVESAGSPENSSAAIPVTNPAKVVDKFGNDATWWRNHKNNLVKQIKDLEFEKEENSKKLRILGQEHREHLRDDRAESLRKRQTEIEHKLPLLKAELDDIGGAVVHAGGLPGWVR